MSRVEYVSFTNRVCIFFFFGWVKFDLNLIERIYIECVIKQTDSFTILNTYVCVYGSWSLNICMHRHRHKCCVLQQGFCILEIYNSIDRTFFTLNVNCGGVHFHQLISWVHYDHIVLNACSGKYVQIIKRLRASIIDLPIFYHRHAWWSRSRPIET